MTVVCGVDGSRTGWVAVIHDLAAGHVTWKGFPSLSSLVQERPDAAVIAIDVPIGLPAAGPRGCDLEARRLLGKRGSSVFPAPIRPALSATSHAEASAARRRAEGKGMSIQAWAILPKVREVDRCLREDPRLGSRVLEVHPELCFRAMAGGRSMASSKRKAAGREERAGLLSRHFPGWLESALADRRALGCEANDILDAFAAAWTAARIVRGEAIRLPAAPNRDPEGLPMQMFA